MTYVVSVDIVKIVKIVLESQYVKPSTNGKTMLELPEYIAKELARDIIIRLNNNASNDVKICVGDSNKVQQFLPNGYREIGRREADPKYHGKRNVYVYGKDSKGNYGFIVVDNGVPTNFSKLGSINEESIIGSTLKVLPNDRFLTKKEIWKLVYETLGIKFNGRRLKAVLDILEIEGLLESKKLFEQGGIYAYRKISKDRLEGDDIRGTSNTLLSLQPSDK